MDSARDRILQRLRARTAGSETREDAKWNTPQWDVPERIRRFTERMEAVRAEVHPTVADDWPGLLFRLAAARGVRTLLYGSDGPLAPRLESMQHHGEPRLAPYDAPVETWKERLFFETDAAVTSSLGGIAETGTLVLWPTPEEPRLMSLVPPVHFCVLAVSALYPTFTAAMAEQRWAEQMPTNALLISGPSKSADIEQTLAYGVHGPRELVVLLVDDQAETTGR
jgi:L-lactate dehydrogenase complex protein LldG